MPELTYKREKELNKTVDNLLNLCRFSDAIFKALKDADNGVTADEIAERVKTQPATVYKTLQKMIAVEIVDYKRRKGRGKSKFYFLTDAGLRMRGIDALESFKPWIYQPQRSSNADSGIY